MAFSSFEFQVESYISNKELNHQSVSLVIPPITRNKIHNMIYYKVNLHSTSLRGDTMLELSKVLVRDLGTLKGVSVNTVHMLGGVEFKCILMKLIEIRPTIDQLYDFVDHTTSDNNNIERDEFDDKYIVALVLVYIRIQYYYLRVDDVRALKFHRLFKNYISDYRKLKSLDFDIDCWSQSQNITVSIKYMDELIDQLVKMDQIWGIPLGKCYWSNIYSVEDSDSDLDSDSDISYDNSNDDD